MRVSDVKYCPSPLSNNVELDLDASHSHTSRNEVIPAYTYYNVVYETKSLLVRLTADTDLGLLKFTAYNNWLTQRSGHDPTFGQFAFHNRVTVVQGEDSFNLGPDHTVRLAAEYRYNTVNTAPTVSGDVFYDVLSASAMWNWRVTPSVSLTNAVRLDHLSLGRSGEVPIGYPFTNADWNRKLDAISYNSGLVWKADELDTLRLTASRGVQLPSLANAGALVINSPSINLTGVPTLKPTIVSNYELGWDRSLPTLSASVRASVFYQHSAEVASGSGGIIFLPTSVYVTAANLGDSNAQGLELSADGHFGESWRWSLSYRAEFVSDDFMPSARGGVSFLDFEHTTPKHLVKASVGWTQGNWDVDVYAGYQSNTSGLQTGGFGTVLVPVGAYVSVDARAAYRLTDWATIAVSGQNLLQSPQRQTSGAAVERQVLATFSVNF